MEIRIKDIIVCFDTHLSTNEIVARACDYVKPKETFQDNQEVVLHSSIKIIYAVSLRYWSVIV